MRRPLQFAALAAVAIGLVALPALSQPQGDDTIRIRLPERPPAMGTIAAVAPDGTVMLDVPAQGEDAPPLTEGYALLMAMEGPPSPDAKMSLLRAQITDIAEGGKVTVQVGKSAVPSLKAGMQTYLLRPPGVTTAQLKLVPE